MSLNKQTVDTYMTQLASPSPTPGGGSVSALVASAGVGLAEMVCAILLKRVMPQRKQAALIRMHQTLRAQRRIIQRIITTDARMYKKVHTAYALPKQARNRSQKIEKSLIGSFTIMINLCDEIMVAARAVQGLKKYNTSAIFNDARLALMYLHASVRGAAQTAHINIAYVSTVSLKKKMESAYQRTLLKIQKICWEI